MTGATLCVVLMLIHTAHFKIGVGGLPRDALGPRIVYPVTFRIGQGFGQWGIVPRRM